MAELETKITSYKKSISTITAELGKFIVGNEEIIENSLIAMLSGSHVLLEGVPGLGKTTIVKSLARVVDLGFSRIQFTPDLMPADIIGTTMVSEDESGARRFEFKEGPIFGNIILADEINRATPKTQSAMLEAMQEHSVTVRGQTYIMKEPFFVVATENPIEMEGTYPLPEAQVDRFMFKLLVKYPDFDELSSIADRTTGTEEPDLQHVADGAAILEIQEFVRSVPVATPVKQYATKLVLATHPDQAPAPETVRKFVKYGASPRGLQALILAGKCRAFLDGRYNVSTDDIDRSLHPALRHRVILNFEGEAEGKTTEDVIDAILEINKG